MSRKKERKKKNAPTGAHVCFAFLRVLATGCLGTRAPRIDVRICQKHGNRLPKWKKETGNEKTKKERKTKQSECE
jgi:hypothetical protein